jgi:hypothetical protein
VNEATLPGIDTTRASTTERADRAEAVRAGAAGLRGSEDPTPTPMPLKRNLLARVG